jgi:hypothetical protein
MCVRKERAMSISQVAETVELLIKTASRLHDVPMQTKILALQAEYLNCQSALLDCHKEKEELAKQIREQVADNVRLKEMLHGEIVFANGAYWSKQQNSGKPGHRGPYCPGCFHTKKDLVPMSADGGTGWNICAVCHFKLRGTAPPK